MRVLAVETATEYSSVAVVEDGQTLAHWAALTAKDLCQRLAREIGEVMKQAGISFNQLDLIASGLGPGSFTSLRIGLATAKGLALAYNLPIVGLSSLETMALQLASTRAGYLLPLLDARRGEVYGAVYHRSGNDLRQVVAPFVGKPETLREHLSQLDEPITAFGVIPPEMFVPLQENMGKAGIVLQEMIYPNAEVAAVLSERRFEAGNKDELASLRPIYVRRSYAEEAANLDLGLR